MNQPAQQNRKLTTKKGERKLLKVLQVNLNRCRVAHDLLEVTVAEWKIDICIISEPNRDLAAKENWLVDENVDVAIWLSNTAVTLKEQGKGKGLVWINTGDAVIYSCYISPNKTQERFTDFLDDLGDSVSTQNGNKIIIAGDFNAAATEWGSVRTNRRGWALLEWTAARGLEIVNDGETPTFYRREQTSFIDLTLCKGNLEIKKLEGDRRCGNKF